MGVSTVPRVGFSETFNNINQVGFQMKIPTVQTGTAYWNQGLSSAIKQCMKHDPKYILCYDGDSVFLPSHVETLLNTIKANPDMDAICPVQADRNGQIPLAYAWNNRRLGPYDFSQLLTEVPHGHFGCTILRTSVFARMPKPWFVGHSGADGDWDGAGKRDDDTNFWWNFNKVGMHLYQANRVVIGHMELHVRWQTPHGVIVQTLQDWRTKGPPVGLGNPVIGEMPPGVEKDLQEHQKPPQPSDKNPQNSAAASFLNGGKND